MPMKGKISEIQKQYSNAVKRLQEALEADTSDIQRDASIQRFEFTLDICWKLLKEVLKEKHGIDCSSPKSCFREAYSQKLIEYDEFWLELVDLRNETVHTYNEKFAKEIYSKLPKALDYFKLILDRI